MCRYAADLYPLLKVFAGPDGIDANVRAIELQDPKTVDAKHLVVYVIEDNGVIGCRVAKELLESQRRAAEALKKLGARVVYDKKLPHLNKSVRKFRSIFFFR